jgi:excisionase family DNA binding protein
MEPVNPITVTIQTARKITGLGNTTIWSLIKDRKLETVCVGRRRLIVYRSLEQLLSPTQPDPSPQQQPRGRPLKRQGTHKGE